MFSSQDKEKLNEVLVEIAQPLITHIMGTIANSVVKNSDLNEHHKDVMILNLASSIICSILNGFEEGDSKDTAAVVICQTIMNEFHSVGRMVAQSADSLRLQVH